MNERHENDSDDDPRLTALYRAAASEQPPPALDSAVLAAAHRAAHARPQPAGPMSRWRLPLASAALIVLSASLVLTIYREPSPEIAPTIVARPDLPTSPGAVKDIDKDNVAERQSRSEPAPAPAVATATAAPPKALTATPFPAAAEQAANSAPAPAVTVVTGRAERDAGAAAGGVSPAPAAPSPLADTIYDERKDRAKSTAQSAAEPGTAPLPESWLEQILTLRRQGQVDQAKARFIEFRKRYPDYPLPPALQDWAPPPAPLPAP